MRSLSSGPAWATEQVLSFKTKLKATIQVWCVPVTPAAWEVVAGGVGATKQVQGQPGLHNESLAQKDLFLMYVFLKIFFFDSFSSVCLFSRILACLFLFYLIVLDSYLFSNVREKEKVCIWVG